MKDFILIIMFLGLTLEIERYELHQYSSIEVKGTSYIYLNLNNYGKDEIYIDVGGDGITKYEYGDTSYYLKVKLEYFFSNLNSETEFESNTFMEKSSVSSSATLGYVTYSYSISFKEKKNYLLMKIISSSYDKYEKYKITHTKTNPMWTIYIILGIFALIFIIIIIFWIKEKILKRRMEKNCAVVQPLVPDNQINGYNYAPQGQPSYIQPSQQQYTPTY